MNPQRISNLAVGTSVARPSHTLLVSNRLRHPETATLATASNASMRGVGTVLGTLPTCSLLKRRYRAELVPLGPEVLLVRKRHISGDSIDDLLKIDVDRHRRAHRNLLAL